MLAIWYVLWWHFFKGELIREKKKKHRRQKWRKYNVVCIQSQFSLPLGEDHPVFIQHYIYEKRAFRFGWIFPCRCLCIIGSVTAKKSSRINLPTCGYRSFVLRSRLSNIISQRSFWIWDYLWPWQTICQK